MTATNTIRLFRLTASVFLLIFVFIVSAFGESFPGDSQDPPPADIYAVTVAPAKVASGDTILIEAVFSILDDSPQRLLPMEYFCEIEKHGELIFKSPVKKMNVTNGAKSHLEINLQATGGPGEYNVAVNMLFPDGRLREEGRFSIVSHMEARMYQAELLEKNPSEKSAKENRLLGRWQFITPDTSTPGPELVISKEDGKLAASVSREDADTLWVKIRKTENSLVVRTKSAAGGGGCWYVMEDVITFNNRMDGMPVRSRVLDGSRCVSVGQVSESTLCRME
jgi:hypothetical protein